MTSGTGRVPIEDVYAQVVQFSRESGAQRVILFGSRARGTNRPKSDIDLAIEGCPDFAGLRDRLQSELWSLLKLDIVNLDDDISADLIDEIKRDGRVLYEKV
jgi:predicted nucleotidyltransferase